ncbi:hypothetical protein V7149_09565, partial [Bacillus sp. JJ1503]
NKKKTIGATKMGLVKAFNDWRAARYENHVAQMKDMNKCPECYGRGFMPYPANEFAFYGNLLDCPGCNGSGDYGDWNELV